MGRGRAGGCQGAWEAVQLPTHTYPSWHRNSISSACSWSSDPFAAIKPMLSEALADLRVADEVCQSDLLIAAYEVVRKQVSALLSPGDHINSRLCLHHLRTDCRSGTSAAPGQTPKQHNTGKGRVLDHWLGSHPDNPVTPFHLAPDTSSPGLRINHCPRRTVATAVTDG